MDSTGFLVMTVIGPGILVLVIAFLAMTRNGTRKTIREADRATRALYAEEERRRRQGTDCE